MKHIKNNIFVFALAALFAMFASGCSDNDMDSSSLQMGGDDIITSFSINGKEGTIDNEKKTITLYLPAGTDLTNLVPEFTLSDGAMSDIPSGSAVNFTMPVVFKITNGNTYLDYTVTVKCFEAKITSLYLADMSGNRYEGTVDEAAKTISVYVSDGVDVSRLQIKYVLSDSAKASVSDGASLDFTEPVEITVTNDGVEAVYTITVISSDMPATAFIGTAATVDGLADEEKAAAEWMLANVPRSRYISMQDIISGNVVLDPTEIKAVWWHCDDNSWPSQGWDSREMIKAYYEEGGSLFLSRYAAKYINDVYQIAIDQKEPNVNTTGPSEQLSSPSGFIVADASHPIFDGLNAENDAPVYIMDAGVTITNCLVAWNIWDYSDDHSLASWENGTGAKCLGYETDDSNKKSIVEFPARTSSRGRVICIGTKGFEWNVSVGSDNQYISNRNKLTLNVLNYLAGK